MVVSVVEDVAAEVEAVVAAVVSAVELAVVCGAEVVASLFCVSTGTALSVSEVAAVLSSVADVPELSDCTGTELLSDEVLAQPTEFISKTAIQKIEISFFFMANPFHMILYNNIII